MIFELSLGKRLRPQFNSARGAELFESDRGRWAHDGHDRTGFDEFANFAFGYRTAADHEAGSVGKLDEDW